MSQGGRQIGSVEYDAHLNTDQLRQDAEAATQTLKSTGDAAAQAFSGKTTAAVSGLRGQLGQLKTQLTAPELGKGLLQGVGLAGGLAAFSGVGTAISAVVSFLGDASRAAREDQQNVDHLTASLKANVPAWSGNTSAIDDFIAKGQDLAFTDDDIRNSLASLVARTHDVKKAMDLTREAMDLARFKGMSLADASAALGKVFDGKVAAGAKAAGIAIDKNATSTEALAAIQKAAAGQAETFANSDVGRAQRMQDKWSETQEKIGKGLLALQGIGTNVLGVVVDAVDALTSAIGELGTHFDNLHRIIDGNYKASEDAAGALKNLADKYGFSADAVLQFSNANKLLAAQQAVAAQGTQDTTNSLILADVAALDHKATLQDLADIATKYGLSSEDVANIIQNQTDATNEATQAQQELVAANELATAQTIEWAKATVLANVLGYASAAATSQQTAAEAEYAAALKKRHDEMAAGNTVDTTQLGTLKRQQQALRESQIAFGQWGEVVGGDVAPASSLATAMHHVGDEARSGFKAAAAAAAGFPTHIASSMQDGVAQVRAAAHAIAAAAKNPFSDKEYKQWLKGKIADAEAAKLEAQKRGDTQLVAEITQTIAAEQALLDSLKSKTVTVNVDIYNQSHHALLAGGRASGGPIGPGRWLVGEQGPELVEADFKGWVHNAADTSRMMSSTSLDSGSLRSLGPSNVTHEGKVTVELGPQSIAALRGSGMSDGDVRRIAGAVAGAIGSPANGLVAGLQMRLGTNG